MIGPTGDGAHGEELLRAHDPLYDIAPRETKKSLQIQRREDLTVENGPWHIRGIAGQQLDAPVSKVFFDVVPLLSFSQLVRGVLHEDVHQVLALGCNGAVDARGQSSEEHTSE